MLREEKTKALQANTTDPIITVVLYNMWVTRTAQNMLLSFLWDEAICADTAVIPTSL